MTVQHQQVSFAERALADLSGAYAGVMVGLGWRLGLYRAMAGAGPLSPRQVATRTGCAERYVREWLNSQAAGGYVDYHAASETYELTDEQAAVLADEDSPYFIPPAWEAPVSMWLDEEQVIDAIRSGGGIPWNRHHGRLFCGSAAFYRNSYRGSLVQSWLPALDGVVDKLTAGARVADVGCGHGHSTVIMAEAFPSSRFVGFDPHVESIDAAREHARQAGVAERVRFEIADAKSYPETGFDLICFFDCLHDLGDPVGAARHAAAALAADGSVMLVEPFANDRVEDNRNDIARMYYAASTTVCFGHSLSEEVGLALGAQAGEARFRDVFAKAGFRTFRRAAETPFNLILEARP